MILQPTLCSLLLSRGFTESWLIGLGRKVCCLRSCFMEGSWMLPPMSLRRSTWRLLLTWTIFSCQSSATRLLICFHGLLWPRRSPSRLLREHGLQLMSTYRHLGTQASHGARRFPELAARRSAARAAYQATRKKILSQRRLSNKARVAVARAVVSSRLLYGAGIGIP